MTKSGTSAQLVDVYFLLSKIDDSYLEHHVHEVIPNMALLLHGGKVFCSRVAVTSVALGNHHRGHVEHYLQKQHQNTSDFARTCCEASRVPVHMRLDR